MYTHIHIHMHIYVVTFYYFLRLVEDIIRISDLAFQSNIKFQSTFTGSIDKAIHLNNHCKRN